jgi:hypothetical protein
MRRSKLPLLLIPLAFALIGVALSFGLSANPSGVVYVSPSGDDAAEGTAEAPMRDIGKAINKLTAGGKVIVAAGQYGPIRDKAIHQTILIEGQGSGADRPVIGRAADGYAIVLSGSQNLTFKNIRFDGRLIIGNHPVYKATQPSKNIVLSEVEVFDAGNAFKCGVVIRESQDIWIDKSHIHGCTTGIGGPGNSKQSSNIKITDNLIENLKTDGIQFGNWDNVLIQRNTIYFMMDRSAKCLAAANPRNCDHNDGVQFTGGSKNVKILDNLIAHSIFGQLMLIQPAVGPIEDVVVSNNLIYGSGAYAIQTNAKKLVFINNTVWQSRYGGLLIREFKALGRYNKEAPYYPSDGIIANNILSGIGVINKMGVPNYGYRSNNYINVGLDDKGRPKVPSFKFPGEIYGRDPGFVSGILNDYKQQFTVFSISSSPTPLLREQGLRAL